MINWKLQKKIKQKKKNPVQFCFVVVVKLHDRHTANEQTFLWSRLQILPENYIGERRHLHLGVSGFTFVRWKKLPVLNEWLSKLPSDTQKMLP